MNLHGTRITLRPATESDRRTVYEWLALSDVTPRMMGPPLFPDMQVPTWEEFQEDYGVHFFDGSKPELARSYIIEVDEAAVGHINYDGTDPARGRTELDIWLRSEAFCGHGYGRDALVTLTHHLHRTLGLGEFIIRPSRRNPRAVRAYLKAGFEIVPLSLEQQEAEYGCPDCADAVLMRKGMPGPQVRHPDTGAPG